MKLALQPLARAPGFTTIAILTLALGIGATTAIFSVVHGVVLKPLPYPDSEHIVIVGETDGTTEVPVGGSVSPVNFRDWVRDSTVFSHLAAHRGTAFNLTGRGEPARVNGRRASAAYFGAYGVQPALGRDFRPEEDQPGRGHVAIVSHAFWQQHFGGAADVLGQTILLDGEPHAIVGVMPESFRVASPTDIWTPIAFTAAELQPERRGAHYLNAVARLKPGVTLAQAREEMSLIAARLRQRFPETNRDSHCTVLPLLHAMVGPTKPVLLALLGAVAALLLIACANVANLLLARATARQREIAVRAALGASRAQIAGQLLGESLVLALAGGGLGVVIASWGVDGLLALAPAELPRAQEIGLNSVVLAFTFALSALTGLGFGLAPALQCARVNLADALKDGARSGGDRAQRHRLRGALVVGEIALALMLLVSAGLLMRSFTRLQAVDPGFDPTGVHTLTLGLSTKQRFDAAQRAAFAERAWERFRELPGVTAVGATHILPLSGNEQAYSFVLDGRPAPAPGEEPAAQYFVVSPGYFEAMGTSVVRGRAFTANDRLGAPRVAIVSQSFAARHFPHEDPIGRRVNVQNGPDTWREIVGVVRDVKLGQLDEPAQPQIYEPVAQIGPRSLSFVVRTQHADAGLPAALRRVVRALDPEQPVSRLQTLGELVASSTARHRFVLTLFAVFSGLALLLAAIGTYGVMAYSVAQRRAEFGLRIALGAQARDVLRLVLARGAALVAGGLALGLLAALAATRLLDSLLFGTSPHDPLTFAGIAALLGTIALLACLVPALRAVRVDPMITLRDE